MKVVFITNFINHHQVPLADEMYKLLGDNYRFIATQEIPESFLNSGYPNFSDRQYFLNQCLSSENNRIAFELIDNADVVIIGGASRKFVRNRLHNNKLTFYYSERILKRPLRLLSPYHWYKTLMTDTVWRNKKGYLLCASAYASSDYRVYGAYPNKCFKWGYFTEVKKLDIDAILNNKETQKMQIMWCARFLKWKHPELPIKLAAELKSKGYEFQINMYGSGVELERTKRLATKLGVKDVVSFLGNKPNAEILQEMQQQNIFLFTSDRNEGWGAVLNEAMSNGCTAVASNKIGAVPFLITDKENGCEFKSENLGSLVAQVEILLNHRNMCSELARNAYYTMCNIWSPKNAAQNFIQLVLDIKNDKDISIKEGPCSEAK